MIHFSSSTLWYLTRGSGLVLLVVLTASVVVGILSSGGWAPRHWPRFVVTGLHRNLSLLAVALLVVHVLTAELDPFAPLGWLAVVVPFLSPYRARHPERRPPRGRGGNQPGSPSTGVPHLEGGSLAGLSLLAGGADSLLGNRD
jgi:hypothetical protein